MAVRNWFRIHSFTGTITGLLLFVICWSGTFAVISHELDWLVTPSTHVESPNQPIKWGNILDAVTAWRADADLHMLVAPLYATNTVTGLVTLPEQKFSFVHIDPNNSNVVTQSSVFNIQRFFRNFHRRFFLGDIGLYIVCISSITLIISMVSALVFYKRWWKRFFSLRGMKGPAFWSALHKSAGLWSLWFILIMGITGAWYLFEAGRSDFGDGVSVYAGNPRISVLTLSSPTTDQRGISGSRLDELVANVRMRRPELEIKRITFMPGKVVFIGQSGDFLVRDRANQVHMDVSTGEVLYDQTPDDYSFYWRWSDTADPLHFGDFGGLWSTGVWFIFGLVLSGLILTGTWLHARRLAFRVGQQTRHRWPGTGAALIVTVAVLAASVPFGFQRARVIYGPTADGVQQLPLLAPGVEAVIIGWTAITVFIIAAWVFLLYKPETLAGTSGSASMNGKKTRRGRAREGVRPPSL